jgi:hypothetical protein
VPCGVKSIIGIFFLLSRTQPGIEHPGFVSLHSAHSFWWWPAAPRVILAGVNIHVRPFGNPEQILFWSNSMPGSSPSCDTGPYQPILNRILHFLGTSPDEDHNRHRMVFFLVVLFCIGIAYELHLDPGSSGRESLIKTFSSTITWLVGIYVAGAVAVKWSPAGSSAKDKSDQSA